MDLWFYININAILISFGNNLICKFTYDLIEEKSWSHNNAKILNIEMLAAQDIWGSISFIHHRLKIAIESEERRNSKTRVNENV